MRKYRKISNRIRVTISGGVGLSSFALPSFESMEIIFTYPRAQRTGQVHQKSVLDSLEIAKVGSLRVCSGHQSLLSIRVQ